MKTNDISRPKIVWILILLLVFLGVGALFGGGAFLIAPDGHLIQMPISHLHDSPFPNFLIPGLFLFTFLGIYPLLVAFSLWKLPLWHWPQILNPFKYLHWSWTAALASGVIVLIWITVQVLWVPFGLVHILYLCWGFLLLLVTLHPDVRRYAISSHK